MAEVEMTPTQRAIAENDARLIQQAEFDAKTHGVGTVSQDVPDTVHELFKYVKKLEARVIALESRRSALVK